MSSNKELSRIIKHSMLKAAKLPVIFLILGMVLTVLAEIDDFIPLTPWKHIFDYAEMIGDIFVTLALITFIYKLIILLCRRYERKLNEKHSIASLIVASFRKGLRIVFFLIIINVIITLVGPTKTYLILANNLLKAIIIAAIGWIAIQVLYTSEAVIYQNMLKHEQKNYKRAKALYTKAHIIRNIATVIIIFVTIAAILMSFSSVRNIGISLLASAGFLTAIVGLSAQKTLFSLFSGLQIALAQTIKIGDTIVIDKEESGIVEEITFTYVTLKLGDRRRLIVPINYFIEKSFENWSYEPDNLRGTVLLNVDYLMPIEPLRSELNRVLQRSLLWDGKVSKLQVTNLTPQSVEISIQVSAENPDKLSDLRTDVREKLLQFIQQHYPHYFPALRINRKEEEKKEEEKKESDDN